jgi:hypothetical protein
MISVEKRGKNMFSKVLKIVSLSSIAYLIVTICSIASNSRTTISWQSDYITNINVSKNLIYLSECMWKIICY